MSTFCSRGFTAIRLPDPVLASRSLVIPLVRTADPRRGNADPADFKRWPCNQAELQDDLWALALWLLPEAERIWAELDTETDAVGRVLEPWRALLAVARLLDRHGVGDVEANVRSVMTAYRAEGPTLLEADRTVLVIRALLILASENGDVSDVNDVSDINKGTVTFAASQVVEQLKAMAEGNDALDMEWATPRRVGRILSRLRLPEDRTGKARTRQVTRDRLCGLARAYGVLTSPPTSGAPPTYCEQAPPPSNVTNVTGAKEGTETSDPPPMHPCKWCGTTSWWQRAGSTWICGTCHPDPSTPLGELDEGVVP